MSSQYKCTNAGKVCYHGTKVVDGVTESTRKLEYTIVARTFTETSPWIQIDLEESYCISAVKIFSSRFKGKSVTFLIFLHSHTLMTAFL